MLVVISNDRAAIDGRMGTIAGALRIPRAWRWEYGGCGYQGWSILMAVQPESLEVLEKAAVPPAQARAIVQAIEIEIAGAKDVLVTKQDLLELRHATKQDLS